MAIVINPRAMIEDYLKKQGYLPQNNRNSFDATHNAILEGAAHAMKDLLGVDMASEGLCWDESVTKTKNVYEAFGEAVTNLEIDLLPKSFRWVDELPIVNDIINKLNDTK